MAIEPHGQTSQPDGESDAAELAFPKELLEKLPEAQREQFLASYHSLMAFAGPLQNPIAQKITSQHITDLLAAQDRDNQRDYADRQHSRRYGLWYFLVGGGFFTVMILALVGFNHPELATELIKDGGLLLGGAGGGFGLAEWRRRRETD